MTYPPQTEKLKAGDLLPQKIKIEKKQLLPEIGVDSEILIKAKNGKIFKKI